MKQRRAAGPDGLTSEVPKYDVQVLLIRLNNILDRMWELDAIQSDWSQSLIVSIYKVLKSSCNNHRWISLASILSVVLASIIITRPTKTRELRTRENQVGFIPDCGCIDHIFVILQILEYRNAYRRQTMVGFLDLKSVFNSVDREVLWQCVSLEDVPQKYINLVQALYSNTSSRVRAYGELSSESTTSSDVRQGYPLSSFCSTSS